MYRKGEIEVLVDHLWNRVRVDQVLMPGGRTGEKIVINIVIAHRSASCDRGGKKGRKSRKHIAPKNGFHWGRFNLKKGAGKFAALFLEPLTIQMF